MRFSTWAICILAATLGQRQTLWAHPALNVQIQRLTEQLEKAPENPQLYFKRSLLHLQHADLEAAWQDILRSDEYSSDMAAVDWVAARIAFAQGRHDEALSRLSHYLQQRPDSPWAHVLRAKILLQSERTQEATTHLHLALRSSKNPSVDSYLQVAKLLVDAQRDDCAAETLDRGIASHGPVLVLVEEAVKLDETHRQYEAALSRLRSLSTSLRNNPRILAHEGELLFLAGRRPEARAMFQQALDRLAAYSPIRQRAPAHRSLRSNVRQKLASLADYE